MPLAEQMNSNFANLKPIIDATAWVGSICSTDPFVSGPLCLGKLFLAPQMAWFEQTH